MELTQNILLDCLSQAGIHISEAPPATLVELPPAHLAQIIGQVQRLYEWDSKTNMAIAEGCDFQTLMDMTEPLLDNPVIIYDYLTRVSAHTKETPCDDPLFQRALEKKQMPEELVHILMNDVGQLFPQIISDVPVVIENNVSSHTEIVCQIKVHERFVAYLYLQCSHRPFTQGLLDITRMFTEKLHRLAERELGDSLGTRMNTGNLERLLSQITQGVLRDRTVIEAALQRQNVSPEGEFQLYLVSDLRREMELLHSSLNFVFPDAKLYRCDSYLLILATYAGKNRTSSMVRKGLESHLLGWLNHANVQCGVSRTFYDLSELPMAYQQAKEARDIAVLLSKKQNEVATLANNLLSRNHLARFEDLQMHILLQKCGSDYAKALCEPYIRGMLETDRKNGTDIFSVFFGYLCMNRNTNRTATFFHMHRNSIVYRINRICERYNIDLDNDLTRQRIAMTFAALELFE